MDTSGKCIEMVRTKQPSANGVTYGRASGSKAKQCYAELWPTGANTNTNWKTCLLDGKISFNKHSEKIKLIINISFDII